MTSDNPKFDSALRAYQGALQTRLGFECDECIDCTNGHTFRLLLRQGFPERDYVTAFTFGVSFFGNSSWRLGFPEFGVCWKSSRPWWRELCVIPRRFFDSTLEQGTVLALGKTMSGGSDKDALLIAPFLLSTEPLESLDLPHGAVNLSQLIPVAVDEAPAIKELGLAQFIARLGDGLYDPCRSLIQLQ